MWKFHIYVTPMLSYFIMLTITDTLPFRIQNFFSYSTIAEYSTVEWGKGGIREEGTSPFTSVFSDLNSLSGGRCLSPLPFQEKHLFCLIWETLHVQYTRATKKIGGGVRDYVKEVCAVYQLESTLACVLALNHWFISGLEKRLPEAVWLRMQGQQNLVIYSLTFQCL